MFNADGTKPKQISVVLLSQRNQDYTLPLKSRRPLSILNHLQISFRIQTNYREQDSQQQMLHSPDIPSWTQTTAGRWPSFPSSLVIQVLQVWSQPLQKNAATSTKVFSMCTYSWSRVIAAVFPALMLQQIFSRDFIMFKATNSKN